MSKHGPRANPPTRIAMWDEARIRTVLAEHAIIYRREYGILSADWRAYMRDVRREARKRGLL